MAMAAFAIASITSINTTHNHHTSLIFQPKQHHHQNKTRIHRFRCNGTNQNQESQPQNNAFLKVAWYSSELLGIAASVFRSSSDEEKASPQRLLETVDRVSVVDTIKQDFQRSYFVTGLIMLIFLSYVGQIQSQFFPLMSLRSYQLRWFNTANSFKDMLVDSLSIIR